MKEEEVGNAEQLRLDEARVAGVLDKNEFFGPYGIRALSRYHHEDPYVFYHGRQEYRVAYVPGDSDTGMFGR